LHWLAVAIFSFARFVAVAQLDRTPGLGSPESARFVCRTWRSADGLPQESVWAVAQTRDGYLWIGTGGGLARFDGFHFQVFGTARVFSTAFQAPNVQGKLERKRVSRQKSGARLLVCCRESLRRED
jgi:hypothetical protein